VAVVPAQAVVRAPAVVQAQAVVVAQAVVRAQAVVPAQAVMVVRAVAPAQVGQVLEPVQAPEAGRVPEPVQGAVVRRVLVQGLETGRAPEPVQDAVVELVLELVQAPEAGRVPEPVQAPEPVRALRLERVAVARLPAVVVRPGRAREPATEEMARRARVVEAPVQRAARPPVTRPQVRPGRALGRLRDRQAPLVRQAARTAATGGVSAETVSRVQDPPEHPPLASPGHRPGSHGWLRLRPS
jgi:hypothetical protein